MGCDCNKCKKRRKEKRKEKIITCPTKTEKRIRTKKKVVKHIHPKEIINVHRTVIKHKHEYPVCERDVFETVVKGDDRGCRKKRCKLHESS
ncbi:CotD family spore coat protein, partial [Bacillus sp. JJ722]|uniref:CotD family spore coat protein n=1 Tax=Bacillus sp. JJ722 TaxID=3122973 RepID=UPI002FFE3C6C